MRIHLQRVKTARVTVQGKILGAIQKGYLLLVGIGKLDTEKDLLTLAEQVVHLRVFPDEKGKMNLDIIQVGGAILSVPQFTLYADTTQGNRPGFDQAAPPDRAQKLWLQFNDLLRDQGISVQEGEFGAMMDVALVNEGPVTLLLESTS